MDVALEMEDLNNIVGSDLSGSQGSGWDGAELMHAAAAAAPISQAGSWTVSSKYFAGNGLVRQQIASFDELVRNSIEKIVENTSSLVALSSAQTSCEYRTKMVDLRTHMKTTEAADPVLYWRWLDNQDNPLRVQSEILLLYDIQTGRSSFSHGESSIVTLNRSGRVADFYVDADYVQYISNTAGGAGNIVKTRFELLIVQRQYQQATKLAADAPQGVMHTPEAIQKFQSAHNVGGGSLVCVSVFPGCGNSHIFRREAELTRSRDDSMHSRADTTTAILSLDLIGGVQVNKQDLFADEGLDQDLAAELNALTQEDQDHVLICVDCITIYPHSSQTLSEISRNFEAEYNRFVRYPCTSCQRICWFKPQSLVWA